MTDPAGSHDPSGGRSETPPGAPRWVKVSAVVAFVVLVTLILIAVLAGGDHGPGRHIGAVGPLFAAR